MSADFKNLYAPALAKETTGSGRALLTFLLCLLFAIMYVDRVNISAAASALQKEFALSNSDLGWVFSAFSWTYLASVMFGGWSASRYGSRLTLGLVVIVAGAGTIATGFASSVMDLFAARLIVGLGEGPAFPAATQAMRNWYPDNRYGYIQGITHSASRLGGALTPIVIGWLIVASNWRFSFLLSGGAAVLWSAAWLIYFREDPRRGGRLSKAELSRIDVVAPDRGARTPIGLLTRRMFPVTLVMFAYGWSYWMFLSWLPLYFANRHGTDLKTSSALATLTLLAGVVGNTIGGLASDAILEKSGNKRLARCGIVAFSLTASALCLIPCAFVTELWQAVGLLSCAVFFLELTIAPMYAIPMDITRKYSGLGSAYIIIGVALAGIVSPLAFGRIVDATHNWDIPFAVGIAILLCGAMLTLMIRPDRRFDGETALDRSPGV